MRNRTSALLFTITLTWTAQRPELVDSMRAMQQRQEHAAVERMAAGLLEAAPSGAGPERYEALHFLALARQGQDDPLHALERAQEALVVARELNDTVRMMRSAYLLIKFNVEGHHYAEADQQRREFLALAQRYDRDAEQLAMAHNVMGSMFSRLEDIDSAEFHYRAGLSALYRHVGKVDPRVRLSIMGNLSSTLSEKGRYEEALELSTEALKWVDVRHTNDHAWAVYNLAVAQLFARKYPEALGGMDLADSLNKLGGNTLDLAINLAELRADLYDSIGDIASAYRMIKLTRDLQDTLFERSLNEQLVELEQKFGTRLKEEEIQRLDAQAKEQQERLRLRNVQLYGSLALAVFALCGIVLIWRNLRLKRRHAEVLEQLNAELEDKQGRIEEINGLLRLKVLRTQMDPHFIHNCLNAIRALSLKGEHEKADEYLEGFARLLRSVLEHSVRDRIPLDEEMTFLNDYVKLEQLRLGDDFTWSITADAALLEEEPQVPSLLVQPFVENAIWHGLAAKQGVKRLHVHFSSVVDAVACRVEDNGVGRSEKQQVPGRTSLGLKLTGERLELLTERMRSDGAFAIEDLKDASGAAAGTRVTLRL